MPFVSKVSCLARKSRKSRSKRGAVDKLYWGLAEFEVPIGHSCEMAMRNSRLHYHFES